MKNVALNLAKLGLSAAIIVYLVRDILGNDPEAFTRLRDQSKDWTSLVAAAGCLAGALMLGWTRWCLLARALRLDVRVRDTFRLGFFGYMLDFLALGTLGGDLAKAGLLGREQGRRWGRALASVMIDRVMGLFSLSIVATIAIASADLGEFVPEIRTVCYLMLAFALAGAGGVLVLLMPRVQRLAIEDAPRVLPRVGDKIARLAEALVLYSRRPRFLAAVAGLSLGVPCLNVTGFYLIASGLPDAAPSLADHFVIIPPAMLSGAIPLPMEALGVFEYAVNYLYEHVSGGLAPAGQGFVVALTYRILTIGIILTGVPLYLTARREAAVIMQEAGDGREAG